MSDPGYHETRFAHDPRRSILWRTLTAEVFQPLVQPDFTVLDLGAGYGDFINNVKARRRIAVDAWPGMLDHLDPNVEGIVTPVTRLEMLEKESLDFVLASNIFEHLTTDELIACLTDLRPKMTPRGTLNVLQPNFRYAYREYFDDYTHRAIYTDVGLSNLLEAVGFRILECRPRFLPFSIKGRLPVRPWLIKAYLRSPIKPLAKQMFIRASLC